MGISSPSKQITILSFLILFSLLINLSRPQLYTYSNETHGVENYELKVGVILDMGSWSGKSIDICIRLAISDFYALNSPCKTRIVGYPMDSKGEASLALSALHHLLNDIKVQAIIVPETSIEGKLMALFSDKAKVPFFSFTGSPSSREYCPYLFQIKPDETTTFKAVAALVESSEWTKVIVFYEDTDYGRETIPGLFKYFLERNIVITYTSAISPSDGDEKISEELHKVIDTGMTVFIVHMSSSQASSLLLNANKLRMVNEKYTWIITDEAMNLLPSMNSAVIASMEGALYLKPYIPQSSELLNFTDRWRQEFGSRYPSSVARQMNVLTIWAYDSVWALAESVERVRSRTDLIDSKQGAEVSLTSAILVNEISRIRFKGLSGDFQFINSKLVSEALEIIKVRGSKEKRVGTWTLTGGIRNDIHPCSNSELKGPRNCTTIPNQGKKLRIAVPVNTTFVEFLKVEDNLNTNVTTFSGFCIDLFNMSMKALPYEVPFEFVKFVGSNGGITPTYNELASQVYQQIYDGAVADMTILASRSQWVDFTVTYTDLGVGTIVRMNDDEDAWIMFKPLGLVVWLTTAASFIIMGFLVWLFEHPINEEFQGSPAQQIGTVLWFAFSTLFFAQRERLSSNWSKFVLMVWLFIVLILIACYTAILSSMLTVQQIKLASKGNNIGYHSGSFVQGVIVDNMNYHNYTLQPYQSVHAYADALSRGSKKGGVDAIFDETPYLKIVLAQYPDDFAMISSNTSTSGFGFAFQKGSKLVHDLSLEIIKLREDGGLFLLEEKWFKRPASIVRSESANKPKILTFDDLGGLFYIGASVSGLALLRYVYTFFQGRLHHNKYMVIVVAGGRLVTMMKYIYRRNRIWNVEELNVNI